MAAPDDGNELDPLAAFGRHRGVLLTQGDNTMKTKQNFLVRFCGDVRGISSVEYALLLAFVGIGIVGAAGALSVAVQGEMTGTAGCLTSAALCN